MLKRFKFRKSIKLEHADKISLKRKQNLIMRIALMGTLLATLIAIKFAFGFILGIEFITVLFAFFSLFMLLTDLLTMAFAFALLCGLVYGFGTWLVVYFVLIPIEVTLTFLLRRIVSKNLIIFASYVFILGNLWTPAYFFSDLAIWDIDVAKANIITSVPVTLVGGLSNMLFALLGVPLLAMPFQRLLSQTYNVKYIQRLSKELKRKYIWAISMSVIGVTGIVITDWRAKDFINWSANSAKHGGPYQTNNSDLLSTTEFNQFQSNLKDDQCGIYVNYFGQKFESTLDNCSDKTLGDYIIGDGNVQKGHVFNDTLNTTPTQLWFTHNTNFGGMLGHWVGDLEINRNGQHEILSKHSTSWAHLYLNSHHSSTGMDNLHLFPKDIVQIVYENY